MTRNILAVDRDPTGAGWPQEMVAPDSPVRDAVAPP